MSIGTTIKRLRRERDITQEQLAEKLGIAPRTLCGIELGKNFFTADTLEKILEVLDITPQDLFKINHLTEDIIPSPKMLLIPRI